MQPFWNIGRLMLVNVNVIEVTAIIASNDGFDKRSTIAGTLLTLTSSNHCRFYHKRKNEESFSVWRCVNVIVRNCQFSHLFCAIVCVSVHHHWLGVVETVQFSQILSKEAPNKWFLKCSLFKEENNIVYSPSRPLKPGWRSNLTSICSQFKYDSRSYIICLILDVRAEMISWYYRQHQQ